MAALFSIIFGFIDVIVGLRFVFRLVGAAGGNALTAWIYNVSGPLVSPFAGMFGQTTAVQGSVIEWFTIVALIVYAIIGALVIRLVASPYHHRGV